MKVIEMSPGYWMALPAEVTSRDSRHQSPVGFRFFRTLHEARQ